MDSPIFDEVQQGLESFQGDVRDKNGLDSIPVARRRAPEALSHAWRVVHQPASRHTKYLVFDLSGVSWIT